MTGLGFAFVMMVASSFFMPRFMTLAIKLFCIPWGMFLTTRVIEDLNDTTDVSDLWVSCLLFFSAMWMMVGASGRPRRNLGQQSSPILALARYIACLILYVINFMPLNRFENHLWEHLLTIFMITALGGAAAFVKRFALNPRDCRKGYPYLIILTFWLGGSTIRHLAEVRARCAPSLVSAQPGGQNASASFGSSTAPFYDQSTNQTPVDTIISKPNYSNTSSGGALFLIAAFTFNDWVDHGHAPPEARNDPPSSLPTPSPSPSSWLKPSPQSQASSRTKVSIASLLVAAMAATNGLSKDDKRLLKVYFVQGQLMQLIVNVQVEKAATLLAVVGTFWQLVQYNNPFRVPGNPGSGVQTLAGIQGHSGDAIYAFWEFHNLQYDYTWHHFPTDLVDQMTEAGWFAAPLHRLPLGGPHAFAPRWRSLAAAMEAVLNPVFGVVDPADLVDQLSAAGFLDTHKTDAGDPSPDDPPPSGNEVGNGHKATLPTSTMAIAPSKQSLCGGVKAYNTRSSPKRMTVKYPVRGVFNRGTDCYAIAICQAFGAAAGATTDFDLGPDFLAEAVATKIREIQCGASSEPVASFQPRVLRLILGLEDSDDPLTVHQSALEFFTKVAETCIGHHAKALLGWSLANGNFGSGLIFHMGAGESTLPELLLCEEMTSTKVGVDFEHVPNLVAVEVVRKLPCLKICRRKVNIPMSITIKTTGSPAKMWLSAVVLHSGDTDSTGHYTCIVGTSDGPSYLCNDAVIKPLTTSEYEVVKKNACLLFYGTTRLASLLPICQSGGHMSDDDDGSDAIDGDNDDDDGSDYSDDEHEEDAQSGDKRNRNGGGISRGSKAHCMKGVLSMVPAELQASSKCLNMFDDDCHLALIFFQSAAAKHHSYLESLSQPSDAACAASAVDSKQVNMKAVRETIDKHNTHVAEMPRHAKEAMTSGNKKACRGRARVVLKGEDQDVSILLVVALTFPTRGEVQSGTEVEVTTGGGFGSTSKMVDCLSWEACATAMSFMPIVDRFLEEHPTAAVVLFDGCPSSTSEGSQQKVPCGGILGMFKPSSEKLVLDLAQHASGFHFVSEMAYSLCGNPELHGVPYEVQETHPGQALFCCASMPLKKGYMLTQVDAFFDLASRAGASITAELVKSVADDQLKVVTAKNTNGRFWNVASWVTAMHRAHKLLFEQRPGGDPNGQDFAQWKHAFHAELGKLGGKQLC